MDQQTLNLLLQQVIEQAKAVDIPVSDQIHPQVKLNSRAIGRFGCCILRDGIWTIELSSHLLEAQEYAVLQTLAHEVLHTCPGCSNHGILWKRWATQMNQTYGYKISRTDTPEKLGLSYDIEPQYKVICTRCGTQIGRHRRSSLIQHPERYRCRCGGRLKRINSNS